MAIKDSVRAIPLLAVNAAALLPAVWQAITPIGGMVEACSSITIRNRSNRTVRISYDNANTNEVVLADSVTILNFQQNAHPNNYCALLARGTEISVQGAIGGAGFIYVSGFFQEEQP